MMKPIPLFLPSSPGGKPDRPLQHLVNVSSAVDTSFGVIDATPVPRELYRTCIQDDLRASPESDRESENENPSVRPSLHSVSIQAFNTPHPIKALGEVVRVISPDDDSESSVTPPAVPLASFKVAIFNPPTPFHDSKLPTVSKDPLPVAVGQELPAFSLDKSVDTEIDVVNVTPEPPPVVDAPPPPPIVNVEFTNWALLPTRKFSGFFVEGKNVASGCRANTSRIVERLDFTIIKSASGAVIRLVGAPDERKMLRFYISRSFVSLFAKGFPTDWDGLVSSELERLRGASEGIRNRIVQLLEEITSLHQPMSHSRDISLSTMTITESVSHGSHKGGRNRKTQIDPDKTTKLPPIVETPDLDVGPHHFPIETFTPKNDRNFDVDEDEEDDEEEEEGLDSSSSMVESRDLSEADDPKHQDSRKHYSRRRARQGNKPAPQQKYAKKASTAVKSRSKKPVAAKPTAAKTVKKPTSGSKNSKPVKVTAVKKPSLVKMTSTQKMANSISASLSTDLQPPPKPQAVFMQPAPVEPASKSKAKGNKFQSPNVTEPSPVPVVEPVTVAADSRKRKEPPAAAASQEIRGSNQKKGASSSKTNVKAAVTVSQVIETVVVPSSKEKAKPPSKRASPLADSAPPATSSKRSKKVDNFDQPIEEVQPRTTRARQPKNVAASPIDEPEEVVPSRVRATKGKPNVNPAPVVPVAVATKTNNKARKGKSPVKQPEVVDEFEFQVPIESQPKVNTVVKGKVAQKKKPVNSKDAVGSRASSAPTKQPNPLRNSLQSVSRDGTMIQGWNDAEIERLKRAIVQVPTNSDDYWKAVANLVGSKNAEECFAMYNKRMDIQKDTHCNLMLSKLVPNMGNPDISMSNLAVSPVKRKQPAKGGRKQAAPAKKAAEKPAPAPSKTAAKGKRVITAGAGTLKRREQIRAAVQEEAADGWANCAADDSLAGGLTKSERAALMGDNMALVTPSAGAGTLSMVTAGGQALTGFDTDGNGGTSMISSALEVPDSKARQDDDKLVARIRATGHSKAQPVARGGKAAAPAKGQAQTLRKKAMALDHLSPMAGKLRGFMPKNMSTPHAPLLSTRHPDDGDVETLTDDSDATINNDNRNSNNNNNNNNRNNNINNKNKINGLSPIYR